MSPKLIWKLKDPKSCEGCPMLHSAYAICTHNIAWEIRKGRPQACIDELGE